MTTITRWHSLAEKSPLKELRRELVEMQLSLDDADMQFARRTEQIDREASGLSLVLPLFENPLQGPPTHRVPKPPQQQNNKNSPNPKFFENPLE